MRKTNAKKDPVPAEGRPATSRGGESEREKRSADEMRSMRHLMAAEARPGTDGERNTDTDDTDVF